MIRYLDVCSGYSAFTQGATGLGFECAGYAEIDAFPCALLGHHYGATAPRYLPDPDNEPTVIAAASRIAANNAIRKLAPSHFGNRVVNFGDFTQIKADDVGPVQLLTGGTPCQSFSVAGSAKDWTTRAATSRLSSWRWLNEFARSGWSGRTSTASCRMTEDERWEPSSGSWGSSGMGGPTECWTLNLSEWTGTRGPCPSDGDVCSLSHILETRPVPQRYYLTAKACAGILRRAAKRGKALPLLLARALTAVAGLEPTSIVRED